MPMKIAARKVSALVPLSGLAFKRRRPPPVGELQLDGGVEARAPVL